MGASVITREDLAPLLEGTWTDDRAAFLCLSKHLPVLTRALHPVWRKRGHQLRLFNDEGDLLHHTLADLVTKAKARQGLALPPDWNDPDLTRWLARVVVNQAWDVARSVGCREHHTDLMADDKLERLPFARAASMSAAGAWQQLEHRHDAEVVVRKVGGALADGDIPPAQALAWALLNRPDLVSPDLVERACGQVHQGHRDTARGPVRSAEETTRLLGEWEQRHGCDPTGRESRRELAWILRSEDRSSPAAWRTADPDECSKAQDTLRQWATRGHAKIQALAKKEVQ
jgi:hypothetical protein